MTKSLTLCEQSGLRADEQTSLVLHRLERESCTEFYLSAFSPDGSQDILREVAEVLAANRIQAISEKLYGHGSVRVEALARRAEEHRRCGLDETAPVSFMDGRPVRGEGFNGVQIWGVAGKAGTNPELVTRTTPAGQSVRIWTAGGYKVEHFPAIDGRLENGKIPCLAAAQGEQMLVNASAALASRGYSFKDVTRTWIYLDRLLDWYGEFNRIRTLHYAKEGLGRGAAPYPPSTGIQGRISSEQCAMDLLVIEDQSAAVRVCPLPRSARQGQAFAYGSSFLRGLSAEIAERKTVYVSGTASIDLGGATIHHGDAELQCMETLLCIAALLEEAGGSLADISMATVFCKTPEVFEAYRRITRLLGLPSFPALPVLADICRSELLVEIEAVAVI